MALKVGDLYVSLTANTQKLQSQLNSAAKKIEKFGKQLKSLGKDASGMSNMVTAAVAAAVAVASTKDAAVKKRVDELKNQSTALAIELARIALPVLQKVADFVGRIVSLFRSMTPEQRAMVATFIEVAAAVSAVGMVAMRLEPAFKLVASAIGFVSTALGGLSMGLIPALAGVAALIGAAALMREYWDQNLGGIQEKAHAVWSWMLKVGPKIGEALGGVASFIGEAFHNTFVALLEEWTRTARILMAVGAAVATKLFPEKKDLINKVGEALATEYEWIKQLPTADGLKSFANTGLEVLDDMKAGVGKISTDIRKSLKGLFDFLPKAANAKAFKDLEKAKTDYGRLRADRLSTSFTALDTGANLKQAVEMAGGKNVPEELANFTAKAFQSAQGIEDLRDKLHELGAAAGEAGKWAEERIKSDEKAAELARHVDRLRSDRAPLAADKFLAGGSFGDAARMAGVTTGIPDWLETLSGSKLKTLADFEDIEDALSQVRDLSPVVREFFDSTKKTFTDGVEQAKALAEEQKKKAEELAQAREQAISGFGDSVIGSLGKAGGVIQAATGPLAQAAGPIGAVVAVAFDLLKDSAQFGELTKALDDVMQGLSDALGQVLPPVTQLVHALKPVVTAAGQIVAAVVPLVTQVLQPLLPVFVMLGVALGALAPLIDVIARILGVVLVPTMMVLEGVFRIFFEQLKAWAIIILSAVIGVGTIWNAIVSAVQVVMRWLADIDVFGAKPFEAAADWANSLEGAKAPVAAYAKTLDDTRKMTWDAATDTATSFGNAAAAADEVAGSMLNVASGFKVDLARFNATSTGPGSPADYQSSGSALSSGDTYVTIVSNDPEAIWTKMEAIRRTHNFRRGRGPIGGLPAFGG